ncbi:MAG: L,D-transpeptidase [Salinarimonadaceae bacterium]|nr:MAG: L,D-transpeptidase [Salinarimonadaceae bacterium]
MRCVAGLRHTAMVISLSLWKAKALGACLGAALSLGATTGHADEAPLHLVISLSEQTLSVYRGAEHVDDKPVSTGRAGFTTPTGSFTILEQRRWHRSNLYDDAPMPFMQRLTWSGIALHAGALPGYPASHGCVRLRETHAQALFRIARRGDHVTIVADDARPARFVHPALPREGERPQAPEEPTAAYAGAASNPGDEAASQSPLRILLTLADPVDRVRETQRLLAALGHDPGPIDGLMGRMTGAAIGAFQRAHGVPETRSLSDALLTALREAAGEPEPSRGRLFVRRDFRPLFDAPVEIADHETPLGTHVLLYAGREPDTGEAIWTATSADAGVETSPAQALSRFALPEALLERLGRSLRLGSSLVVTDRGFGRDSGRLGGDFIVPTVSR